MSKLNTPKEWREQEALVTWAKFHSSIEPRLALLFCIPNGEHRQKATAAKLARMGVQAGVPDLCLPVPRWANIQEQVLDAHGLYIEMKRPRGNLTAAQRAWHALLRAQGYYAGVAHGWVEAAKLLAWYLDRLDLVEGL